MTAIRRALLFTAGERALGIIVGLAMIPLVSRLLTPAEIGISVIGLGVMTFAVACREFASADFLIQKQDVTPADVRTCFSILLALCVTVSGTVALLAPHLARLYDAPDLQTYLYIAAAAGVLDPFALPVMALLRRDMQFDRIAGINTAAQASNAVVTVLLAAGGFGVASMAWGWFASSAVTLAGTAWARPTFWMVAPSFRAWRSVVTFGGYNGATSVVARLYEALPQLVLGRIVAPHVIAFYNRTSMIVGLPDRLILSVIFPVALPAFASEFHAGRTIKDSYLRTLGHLSALLWPALLFISIMAHPIVGLLLGPQWEEVAPLVPFIALPCLVWFPVALAHPLLLALGQPRDVFLFKALSVSVCSVVLISASPFGLTAMVATHIFTIPFQMLVAQSFVRRHVRFQWSEVAHAVSRSAVVAAGSAAGPLAVVAAAGGFDVPPPQAALAGVLCGAGWLVGLMLTRHPLMAELSALAVRLRLALTQQRHTAPGAPAAE